MLIEVADGVLVRRSAFCRSNATVIRGATGLLLVDPGVDGDDLADLADDLDRLGVVVTAGFATHPHWDHLLWHPRFGDVPRYCAAACAVRVAERVAALRAQAAPLAPGAPLELLGRVSALPAGATQVPWDGPAVRVLEHQGHAPGHAALVVGNRGVLLAADMLSDVEIPLLDPDAADPAGDYLAALEVLEAACADVATVVPGHGGVGTGAEIRARLAADRHYVESLRAGTDPADPRLGPRASYGTDWLPGEHDRNRRLARP